MSLAAVAVSYGGPSQTHPRVQLAATEVVAPSGWTQRPPLQVPRIGLDVATVAGDILAIGGFDPAEPDVFSSVEGRAVAANNTWHTVAPMPTARANAAAAELNGSVYVAGGFTNDATVDVVERYDPLTDSWSLATRLPAPRGAAAAAALGGLLYVAGGAIPISPTDDEITASVIAFNPKTGAWTAVAPMPTPRQRLRLVAVGGFLFAIGGQSAAGNTLSTVERYDPRFNRWTAVASMNQDRGVPGVVVVNNGTNGLIVAVGGCQFVDGQLRRLLQSTEVYDLNTGKWSLVTALLPQGTCSLGAAVEGDGSVLAIAGAVQVNGVTTATAQVEALSL